MNTKRFICVIDPANDSSLRIRVLLALHTSGQECLQAPEQMQKKLSEKHGQKFSLFEIEQTLLVLEKDELVRRQMGCFKLSSDARDQMEDLPNRCTKAQWDHIIGLATTGAFPVLHGYKHQPEGSKVRNIHHRASDTGT